jgi:hypothetical protein
MGLPVLAAEIAAFIDCPAADRAGGLTGDSTLCPRWFGVSEGVVDGKACVGAGVYGGLASVICVCVCVCVCIGVSIGIGIGVSIGVCVSIGVSIGVCVSIGVSIGIGIGIGVCIGVCVCVGVCIGVCICISVIIGIRFATGTQCLTIGGAANHACGQQGAFNNERDKHSLYINFHLSLQAPTQYTGISMCCQ